MGRARLVPRTHAPTLRAPICNETAKVLAQLRSGYGLADTQWGLPFATPFVQPGTGGKPAGRPLELELALELKLVGGGSFAVNGRPFELFGPAFEPAFEFCELELLF